MILISGATGFLGSHLLKTLCLQNAEPIKAMYRSKEKKSYTIQFLKTLLPESHLNRIENISWVKADILDIYQLESAFAGVEQVYHCAAWVGNAQKNYNLMRQINIEGTANMVNLAISFNIKKFCHVSSVAALGKYPDKVLIDEQAPRDSDRYCSRYSITKYGAEMETWRASQEGLDVVIVNPAVILGAGFFDSGSGLIFDKVLNNFKFYPPKQTGFVYVDDVTQAMTKLMSSTIKNQRYILVAENISFKGLMDNIAEVFNRKKPNFKAGKPLLYLLWLFQKIIGIFKPLKTQVTLNTIKQIHSKRVFDNQKSIHDLEFKYTPIDKAINLIFEDYKKLKNIS